MDTAMNCRSQHAKRSPGTGLRNDDVLRLNHLASQIFRRFARLIYLVYTIQSCTMFHEPLETYKFKISTLDLETIAQAPNFFTGSGTKCSKVQASNYPAKKKENFFTI
jgi:hypothetical protein